VSLPNNDYIVSVVQYCCIV